MLQVFKENESFPWKQEKMLDLDEQQKLEIYKPWKILCLDTNLVSTIIWIT